MTKLGTPMLAAVLAVVGFASVANAAVQSGNSYGTYYVNTTAAPVVLTQPAVLEPAVTCPSSSAVVVPSTAVVETVPATTIVSEPVMLNRTLEYSAIMLPSTGFSMDPLALRLYTGPRFENTLTVPDANTYLRP